MKMIVNTIKSMDENTKQILFQNFEQEKVNELAKKCPDLIKNINAIDVPYQT